MERQVSLTLDDEQAAFVEMQISTGRYGAVGEIIAAGLRLLEREAVELSALRAALVEGEDSGPSTPFDFDDFIAERLSADFPRP